ncbi:F-box/WD repeat-containing protein 7-like isoform X1 [Dinothrombium tinctorium]|uniref:F-box/WD repeat-containing protein 7-like isoform X1 n=1 Tax=Dinothrombium tinctorium TaxID=1965070 RepID=A0A3S3NX57_9ACAR|nr:F-box/WD repeat-containing protein 7-like isoform X1 [Dinothrombium tinctorium]
MEAKRHSSEEQLCDNDDEELCSEKREAESSEDEAVCDSLINCAISKKRKLELNKNALCKNDSNTKRVSLISEENSCDNSAFNCANVKPSRLQEWLQMFHNWSNCERLAALDALVSSEICDIQQIRYLLSLIEPQLQRDFISLLPKELSLYVLAFLEPKDLLKAAQTCRYWRILCEDNLLWREKCLEEGLLDDNETIVDLFRKRLSRTPVSPLPSPSASTSSTASVNSPFVRSEYKLAYLRQKSIEYNWRYGRFPNDSETSSTSSRKCRYMKEILHLKGHDDHVITCLQFNPNSNLIVSGSDDNTLKVWSSKTGRCLRTLTGHTGGVWSSQLSPNNIVISGSTDRTLKVWNALTGECIHTLYGHTSTVRCMALHGSKVVSGSRDATLRVWDINTGECCHVLVGHVAAVRCVQFNGKIVVSGAYDYLVKVWDVNSETCLHTLEGHTNRVYSLQFDGENIVSGSLDTSIRVWSATTGVLKHTLIGHQSLTSGMQLRGSILVSGNADSTVKVWDINNGQCLQTLAGPNKHQSAVTCLQFNSRFVITSSDDGTVKLWDLRTGEFIRNLVSLSSGGSGGVVWRIRASNTKLVCAVGSRNGTEETKLLVLDFDPDDDDFMDNV